MVRFFLKFIGILGAMAIGLGVAEVAVRLISPQEVGPVRFVCDPELGNIPVPYQQGERRIPGIYTFRYSNNSLGWRGRREYRGDKPTEFRVLCLGDSYAYGIGVNDDQTFPAQIEQILRADRVSVEVLNAGCPGKGTDYELKCFQTVGRKFHPDLTVLCVIWNDFQDNTRGEYYNIGSRGELQAKPINCRQGGIKSLVDHLPLYNWLLSRSEAANLIKQAVVKVLASRAHDHPEGPQNLVVSYNRAASGSRSVPNKELMEIYFRQLNEAVKQAGSELMVFYFPVSPEVQQYQQNRTFSGEELTMQGIAAANGLTLRSLTPLLAHSGRSIDSLYYQEGHCSAPAHAIAARYLSRLIQTRLVERRQGMEKSMK